MKQFKQFIHEDTVIKSIEYHIENNMPISECVFRPHSDGFYKFFIEARRQYSEGILEVTNPFDIELLETDIGEHGVYDSNIVPLDIPMMEADEEEVELNKPKRGGSKKFYVYTKNDKGNVIKISFGDNTGLDVNFDDDEARKSFAARHQCHLKKDKATAGYWSCNLPKYAKSLGLKNGGNFFW
jgi:hypothetical protein